MTLTYQLPDHRRETSRTFDPAQATELFNELINQNAQNVRFRVSLNGLSKVKLINVFALLGKTHVAWCYVMGVESDQARFNNPFEAGKAYNDTAVKGYLKGWLAGSPAKTLFDYDPAVNEVILKFSRLTDAHVAACAAVRLVNLVDVCRRVTRRFKTDRLMRSASFAALTLHGQDPLIRAGEADVAAVAD